MTKTLRSYRGFTIVELLVVIVVVGILAAITIVAYNGIQQRATVASLNSDLNNASKRLKLDQVDLGAFPATTALANGGLGLRTSSGTTYQYTVNNTNPQTFCLTATNGSTSYYINQDGTPQNGGCAGHGVGGVAAVTNLAINPAADVSLSNWNLITNTGSGSVSYLSSGGPAGINTFIRGTIITPPTSAVPYIINGINNNGRLQPVQGAPLWSSAWVRSNRATSIKLTLVGSATDGSGWNNSLIQPASTTVTLAPNVWTRLTYNVPVYPNDPGYIGLRVLMETRSSVPGFWQAGDTLDATGLMVTTGSTLYNYADGYSANWIWNGTANASTSTGPSL